MVYACNARGCTVTCPHKCMLLWASSEDRWANEHFIYTNTSSPFKMTKPFQDTESSQSSGILYTDWLCLNHWSCNWWFLTKPLTAYKFKFFTSTADVFLCTDLSSYKTGDCHLPLFLQWLTMLMFVLISFLFFYYTRHITSIYTFKSWHFHFMTKTGDEH